MFAAGFWVPVPRSAGRCEFTPLVTAWRLGSAPLVRKCCVCGSSTEGLALGDVFSTAVRWIVILLYRGDDALSSAAKRGWKRLYVALYLSVYVCLVLRRNSYQIGVPNSRNEYQICRARMDHLRAFAVMEGNE